MTKNRFRLNFVLSEAVGFLFGAPVATAYALLLTTLNNTVQIIQVVCIVTVIIVAGVGMPTNIFLLRKILKSYDDVGKGNLPENECLSLFNRLTNLPILHGFLLFSRVAIGSIVVGLMLVFYFHEILIQAIIAICLAFYGAFIAGLIAYLVVSQLVRPISESIVKSGKISDKFLGNRSFFGLGHIATSFLFIILPIIFSNLTLILNFFASNRTDLKSMDFQNRTIGVIIVNVITLIIIATLNIYSVKQKLIKVQNSAKSFASNTGDLTVYNDTDLTSEFSYIQHLLNKVIANIRNVLWKIKQTSGLLFSSTNTVGVSSREISTTATQQAAAVKEIVTTMEDSNILSRGIQQKIIDMTQIAQDNSKLVQEGQNQTAHNKDQMEAIKTNHVETIKGIQELNDQIEGIWEIVTLINSIADQTKIIAFNAELEAVSASDEEINTNSNKNFEIVATEIRRLADSTVKATKEIRLKINEIQKTSSRVIHEAKSGTETVSQGWIISARLEEIFKEIKNSSELTYETANQVNASIGQQASASEQILLTLKQISDGINQFVLSTEGILKHSQDLRVVAEDLELYVESYKVE